MLINDWTINAPKKMEKDVQNCGLRHKVLKVEGGDSGKISLLQFGLIYWNATDVAITKSLKHGFQGDD